MSEKEFKKTIKIIQAYNEKVSSTRDKAVESLNKAGICDKKGNLKPQYK